MLNLLAQRGITVSYEAIAYGQKTQPNRKCSPLMSLWTPDQYRFQHIDRVSRAADTVVSLGGAGWVNHEFYYAALAFTGRDSG